MLPQLPVTLSYFLMWENVNPPAKEMSLSRFHQLFIYMTKQGLMTGKMEGTIV